MKNLLDTRFDIFLEDIKSVTAQGGKMIECIETFRLEVMAEGLIVIHDKIKERSKFAWRAFKDRDNNDIDVDVYSDEHCFHLEGKSVDYRIFKERLYELAKRN